MVTIFRLFFSCLIALLIPIESCTVDETEIQERLIKNYRMEKPEGKGPFPAVMLVPGCSGFDANFQKAHYDRVQSRLVDLGFATLRVDYLAARNAILCWPDVVPEDVAGDIFIATEYLRQQPFVKKGAINVLGWSFGGAGVLMALRHTRNREPAEVAAAIVYFPDCKDCKKWDSEVPILALFGAIDNAVAFSDCKKLFTHLPKPHKVTIRVYDDAHHCFDNSDLRETIQAPAGTYGYNEAAAKSAWIEVVNFLRK